MYWIFIIDIYETIMYTKKKKHVLQRGTCTTTTRGRWPLVIKTTDINSYYACVYGKRMLPSMISSFFYIPRVDGYTFKWINRMYPARRENANDNKKRVKIAVFVFHDNPVQCDVL